MTTMMIMSLDVLHDVMNRPGMIARGMTPMTVEIIDLISVPTNVNRGLATYSTGIDDGDCKLRSHGLSIR